MREVDNKSVKGYKNLFRYLSYFKNYKGLIAGFWGLLICTGVISFFSPLLLGKVISFMTVEADFYNAIVYAALFGALEIVGILIHYARVPFFKNLENKVKRDVKISVIRESLKINIGEFEKLGNGTFVTRLTSDIDSLGNTFKNISETIVNFMSKIGFIVFVYITNYWIGIFLTVFVLLRYFIYQVRIHYYAKMKPVVLKKNETTNSMIGEAVRSIKDIKTLGLSENVLGRINNLQEDYMKSDNKEWYVGVALYSFANFVSVLCNFFFIFLCAMLVKNNALDLAIFYSVYVYKNSVMEFAVHLGNLQDYFRDMEVSAARVFALAGDEQYHKERYGNVELLDYKGNIEFKNVSFAYTENEKVLDDVSFKIKANTHVAFVGESGCGKSTIVALICKLYDPNNGVILFDDTNSMSLAQSFGKNISMVNQYPYVFNLSIRENMQLVKTDVTDEEIFEVLKFANADQFVRELPDGLDSFLGEGGTRLSGGQKQRICIARALLKNSKVIIFDEATSALDNISQQYIMDSVEKIKNKKTIITIAHRLSTIENCDVIYFVDKGKIVDCGTHEELLLKNKKYATLYKKQQRQAQAQKEE